MMKGHEFYMQKALEQAEIAAQGGEVPIGAVLVDADGEIIASAYNQVECCGDGMAHAEVLALKQAALRLGGWRMTECTLYVTKEPCAMCAGAMVNCRLGHLVFGCGDSRCGAAGGALDITGFSGMLHRVEVIAGVMEAECLSVLQNFFRRRRKENAEENEMVEE